jgi:hypothetical protein
MSNVLKGGGGTRRKRPSGPLYDPDAIRRTQAGQVPGGSVLSGIDAGSRDALQQRYDDQQFERWINAQAQPAGGGLGGGGGGGVGAAPAGPGFVDPSGDQIAMLKRLTAGARGDISRRGVDLEEALAKLGADSTATSKEISAGIAGSQQQAAQGARSDLARTMTDLQTQGAGVDGLRAEAGFQSGAMDRVAAGQDALARRLAQIQQEDIANRSASAKTTTEGALGTLDTNSVMAENEIRAAAAAMAAEAAARRASGGGGGGGGGGDGDPLSALGKMLTLRSKVASDKENYNPTVDAWGAFDNFIDDAESDRSREVLYDYFNQARSATSADDIRRLLEGVNPRYNRVRSALNEILSGYEPSEQTSAQLRALLGG